MRGSCLIYKPGIALFSQGAAPQLSSPLSRFTTEFGMGRSGTMTPLTPGILLNPAWDAEP